MVELPCIGGILNYFSITKNHAFEGVGDWGSGIGALIPGPPHLIELPIMR